MTTKKLQKATIILMHLMNPLYTYSSKKVGEGIRTISINRDANFKDEDEYYGVIAHKPDDDAYMTMLILKEIIKEKTQVYQ